MSAYAASLNDGRLFPQEDETVIKYENSSDDEDPNINTLSSTTFPSNNVIPNIINPTFTITTDGFIPQDDEILIGLKINESITISGQFILTIERGAVLINGVEYYHAPNSFKIIQPRLMSLPTISSTQVLNTDEITDIKTEDNAHLFSSDYKSIIRIKNWSTGLENITKYHQPFKNLFKVRDDDYTFDIHFNTQEGILYDSHTLSDLNITEDPLSVITIGNKNSGKSTISKLLINKLINNNCPVSVLDLDPGQSEYSSPYCLSITNHYETIHGFNYHQDDDNDLHYYFGFSSPQNNPELYLSIIEHLIRYYFQVLQYKGHHLIINTPGWVKGYGKKLLAEITRLINPKYLILLTSNITDNDDILSDLSFENLKIIKGSFQQSKYSPVDFRIFNKLIYFHKLNLLKYDFSSHLLNKSPLKLSFQTTKDQLDSSSGFIGVNGVSILNHDLELNFDWDDLYSMLDMSIVGVYLIENEYFHSNIHLINFCKESNQLLPYLNGSDYMEMIQHNSSGIKLMGVALIHSINTIDNYFNVYLPPQSSINQQFKQLMKNGYKLILVKGESDIPSCEILMPQLMDEFKKSYKKSFKSNLEVPSIPYVNYNNKINGVWKIRRNVMRRSHRPL